MCIIESLIREGKRRKRQQRERQEEERKKKEKSKDSEERFWWRCEKGKHPYPYRTRRLSPKRPRVLCWRRHGRVGGCQISTKKSLERVFYIELTAPMNQDKGEVCVKGRVNPGQQGSAVLITGFYQWLVNLSPSSLLMTDKISVKNVPWKPHIETIDNFFKKKYQDIRGHVSWKGDMETKKETNKQTKKNQPNQRCNAMHRKLDPVPAGERNG